MCKVPKVEFLSKKLLTFGEKCCKIIKSSGNRRNKDDNKKLGSIAQLGEHLPYKQGVIGSSPIVPTK